MSDEFEGAKRSKKVDNRKRLVVRIYPDLHKEFMEYSESNSYVTAKLVEKILRAFLKTRDDK
jgi:hypothetical protein